MALWDKVRTMLAIEPMQERSILFETAALPIDEQILAIRRRRAGTIRPYRLASVRQALGVPAVFGIVSGISNTVGTLSLDGYRSGTKLEPEARPQLIIRPDPKRRPGSFFRDSAWNLATRGEAWWWVAKRDPSDGSALALISVPPAEIIVNENPRNALDPLIYWTRTGDKLYSGDDMRQITYIREPGELRGEGPLQLCGAAVSVAVESQDWAANYYASGGTPPYYIKHAGFLGAEEDDDGFNEAERLRVQWMDKPNNVPRVIDQNIEKVEPLDIKTEGAQMLSSRDFQTGEVARMFNYPMSLIGYAVAGSSLTYQNVGQELDKLTRSCLIPFYLEKFEQEMTDLLPRTTTCEFNVDRLLRADVKTRADVYSVLVTAGFDGEQAAAIAGFADAGSVEVAPVPFSPPRALPSPIVERSLELRELRCSGCGRLAGKVTGAAEIRCSKCGTMVVAA